MKRTRLKPMSDKMKEKYRIYRILKPKHFEEVRLSQIKAGLNPPEDAPWCEICILEGWPLQKAIDVHHTKKPRKTYLNDKSTWLCVSRFAHNRIEESSNQGFGKTWAREAGYLV